MPVLSRFYGMIAKMYFQQSEHNPPHVHFVYDNQYMGAIDVKTGKMLEGDLPARALKMAQEWVKINRDALLEIWETQQFRPLPPLL